MSAKLKPGATAPATAGAIVLDRIEHDGQVYLPGETLVAPAGVLARLAALGVVQPAEGEDA
jgi:hypothetical protein